MTDKPNILFLFSDQHNARCLSCAGHPDVKTPHLDSLAAQGVRFTNAFTNNPICTPSRISFLSSLYPSTHAHYGLYGPEPVNPMTSMFAWFRELGYRTGALGKLHTPRYWIERDCDFVYDEFLEFPKYLEGAGLFDHNDNRAFTGHKVGKSSLPYEHSCEMALAKQAIRFMRCEQEPADRLRSDAPWMGWVSFSRPHQPYTPSDPFAPMYPADSVTLPPTSEAEPESIRNRRSGEGHEAKLRSVVSAYLGLVSQIDDAIGIILAELDRLGQRDNTIIVYTADHGDYAGEHGLFEKSGGISYSAITRIPMIVHVPGAADGRTLDQLVEAVDLFPTLCDLAGVDTPDTVQGRSLASLVTGDSDAPIRDCALTENAGRKAIATDRWRYIANRGDQADQLFDQQNDPWELDNRIDDPACADVARDLSRKLLDRVVDARRPIHTIEGFWHNQPYDRDGRKVLATHDPMNPYH